MNTSTSRESFFTRLLKKHLPGHIKRLVMLSSLYAVMCNRTTFDTGTVVKLNRIMELGKRDQALNLPMQLSSVIWHRDNGSITLHPLPDVSEEQMVQEIMKRIPDWLVYADKDQVCGDVRKLVYNRLSLAA